MERHDSLGLNRYFKSFVGPSGAQEADSFTVQHDKRKNQTPAWPLVGWTI